MFNSTKNQTRFQAKVVLSTTSLLKKARLLEISFLYSDLKVSLSSLSHTHHIALYVSKFITGSNCKPGYNCMVFSRGYTKHRNEYC